MNKFHIYLYIFLFTNYIYVQCVPCHHELNLEDLDEDHWLEEFDNLLPPEFNKVSPLNYTEELNLPDHLLKPPPPPKEYPPWVSVPVQQYHLSFFKSAFMLLLKNGLFFNCKHERSSSPYLFREPGRIRQLIDISLNKAPTSQANLLQILEIILKYSPHNGHPWILTRRVAGIDPYGLIGDWLGTVSSGVIGSYMLAPGFTLMEIEIGRKVRELVGYPNPNTQGSGVIVSGSGTALQFAMQVALQRKVPGIREEGLFQRGNGSLRPCIFLSTGASYSAEKGALLQGLGPVAIFKVKVNLSGRMILEELVSEIKRAIEDGWTPFLVYATAGTPQVGAIDPINEIAEICKAFKLWLHVDGNIGGGVLLSHLHRSKLAGVEKSDSFSWSMTQSLALPFTTSILVTRESTLEDTMGLGSMPVFGNPPFYNGSYDVGDSTLQTARRADILKIWLIWKAKGKKGLAAHINYNFANVEYAKSIVLNRPKYFSLLPMDSIDLNLFPFVLTHPTLNASEWKTGGFRRKHDAFMEALKNKLLEDGIMQISVSHFKNLPKFLTIFFNNNVLTKQDITYIFDQLESYAGSAHFHKNGSIWFNSTNREPVQIPSMPSYFPSFVSAAIPQLHISLFVKVFKIILDKALFHEKDRAIPMTFIPPGEFEQIFDVSLNNAKGLTHDKLLEIILQIIKYNSLQTHPYYQYQSVSGRDAYSIIADMFTSAINSPMITYEDHPIFTLIEDEILKEIRWMIGYREGDGISTAGGSFSVQIAITLARHKKFPKFKHEGNNAIGGNIVIFTSNKAMRAYMKGAFYSGIGLFNYIAIETDEYGRMNVSELRREIEETIASGDIPLLVAASIGTSIYGAIDPLDEIGDVCEEYEMWFHVDGTYGGAVLFSRREVERIRGIEKSDSFHFNSHKLLGDVALSSMFVTRHPSLMTEALGLGSYGNDYSKGKYDTGDKNIETVRRADLFKFWFLWKAKGTDRLSSHMEYLYDLTEFMAGEMIKHPRFEMVLDRWDSTNICFFYVPDRLRVLYKYERNSSDFIKSINGVTFALQAKLAKEGVTFTQVATDCVGCAQFFRWAITHSGLTTEDIVHLMSQMDAFGKIL